MYAKAQDDDKTPLFSVTPGKACRMYPYLWTQECEDFFKTHDPKDNPFRCRAKGPVDEPRQYIGFPITFKYDLAGNPKNAQEPVGLPPMIGDQPPRDQTKENYEQPSNGCGCRR
jgi:hypothetical protein